MEQIQVVGARPASFYKEEMIKAQLAFFDSYNQLTDNDEFKITCKRKPISAFSRLTKRVCEFGFISEEQYRGTQRAFQSISPRNKALGNLTHNPGDIAIYKKQKKQHIAQLEELKS
ncbi:MAG: hypothetical protein ACFHVJ_10485 [Aestuariibacter sp.]